MSVSARRRSARYDQAMTDINVEHVANTEFRVTVIEGATQSIHTVTVDINRDGVEDGDLVEASFRFLLDREPKESVLSRFDLSVIGHYFPEYSRRIEDYL
jgi:hypothetical protein